jgi:hypothetical protein
MKYLHTSRLWRWNRQCSETLAFKLQTPVNHPEESIQHSEQGESLKSRIVTISLFYFFKKKCRCLKLHNSKLCKSGSSCISKNKFYGKRYCHESVWLWPILEFKLLYFLHRDWRIKNASYVAEITIIDPLRYIFIQTFNLVWKYWLCENIGTPRLSHR